MATLTQIKAAVVAIAQTVSGIGTVKDNYPHIQLFDDVMTKLVADDKLNVLIISHASRKSPSAEDNSPAGIDRVFKMELYYSYQDDVSETDFDNIIEDLVTKFDANITLNGTVQTHDVLAMTSKDFTNIGKVLCHHAVFELTTYED